MADEIIAKNEGGNFARCPEGPQQLVCCDIIELGMHVNPTFGKRQHKGAIVFQTMDVDPVSGKRYEISKRFTVSMHEKADLRKLLSMWRGKSYSEDEAAEGAPLHKLVGVNGWSTIEHVTKGDKTYTNILSIAKMPKGSTLIVPENYVRAPFWEEVKKAGGIGGNGKPVVTNGEEREYEEEEEIEDALPF